MVNRARIMCINKSIGFNPFERIANVGGISSDGTHWKISQEYAVTLIENGEFSFFVSRVGGAVEVIVATSRYGHKYLKTTADGEMPDNLLSLPECPD
jgi:hypothetical protein